MSEASNFKVIIAGGGIGGLTLASALEKAGVDYVLLEKRDIAPELGASITSLPCTTLVHEQLGFGHLVADATLPLLVREHYSGQGRRFARSNETTLLLERYVRLLSPAFWLHASHVKSEEALAYMLTM